jgi:IS5 family transposase
LTEHQKKINRSRSRVRGKGEHSFLVVKRLWGFTKVRYRGLAKNREASEPQAKNTTRAFTAFALANLYLLRRRLRPAGA